MPDAVFLPAALTLLILAAVRRPSRIVWFLVAGLAASLALRLDMFDQSATFIGLFVIDLGVIVALGEPYTKHPNKRARSVAMLGGLKMLATAWVYMSFRAEEFTSSDYHHYAWAIGIAYLAQVSIAGGFFDVVGRWVDDHLRRAAPRFHHALWYVEG